MILRDGVNKEEHTRFMLKSLESINSKAPVGPCSIDYRCYGFFAKGSESIFANNGASSEWGGKWKLEKCCEGHGENILQQKCLFNLS